MGRGRSPSHCPDAGVVVPGASPTALAGSSVTARLPRRPVGAYRQSALSAGSSVHTPDCPIGAVYRLTAAVVPFWCTVRRVHPPVTVPGMFHAIPASSSGSSLHSGLTQ